MRQKTPFEALEYAVHAWNCSDRFVERGRRQTRPGEVIEQLSAPIREQLCNLTSDDALKVRPDWVALHIDKPGFCGHGQKFTEECPKCDRLWNRPRR